jgi:chromosome segregation ATPase
MRAREIMITVIFTVYLGGCAGMNHDPRQGGFFGGVAGLTSGGYKDRVQERESRLAELRAVQSQLDTEKTQLEGRKAAAYAKVEEDRARVNLMQNDIAALEKQAKSLAAQESADRKRIVELHNRIAELKKQMTAQSSALDALEGSGLGDQQVDLRRQQLEQQRNALRREYELLMKMQMELAK